MTSKLKYIALLGVMVIVTIQVTQAQELWTEYGLSYALKKDIEISTDFQNRYINTGKFVNYKSAVKMAVQYKVLKHIKLGASYRYARAHNDFDGIEHELHDDRQRYCFDIYGKLPIQSRFILKNRSRYQVSLDDDASKHFYRNKTSFEIKIDKKTDFYISEELIFRLDKDKPVMNRLSIGLEHQLIGSLYISPFFRIENEKHGEMNERSNIIGAGIHYKL